MSQKTKVKVNTFKGRLCPHREKEGETERKKERKKEKRGNRDHLTLSSKKYFIFTKELNLRTAQIERIGRVKGFRRLRGQKD